MSVARFIVGDSLTELRKLDAGSVDLVVTSPPFLALRSYLPADHPNKALEMGSEGTPGAFLDALLDVVVECRRVLAPHGSLCVELGDTYSGSGGGGGDYLEGGVREGQAQFADSAASMRESNAAHWRQKNTNAAAWPQAKSLCLIPESFRFALVYGRNPHTGRELEPWRARNVVRWVRPNPPVGALGDKFRPATSEIVVACTSARRYFDGDAVRQVNNPDRTNEPGFNKARNGNDRDHGGRVGSTAGWNPAGAPLLDWWKISTQGYAGSHYATFPEALVAPLIKSMCPTRVCTVCGEPSRRITETERHGDNGHANGYDQVSKMGGPWTSGLATEHVTLGWTDCGHDQWRPGITLDPFAGSGTTLAAAVGHGRDALGIDLDERNLHLARERVGMFLIDAPPTVIDAGQL